MKKLLILLTIFTLCSFAKPAVAKEGLVVFRTSNCFMFVLLSDLVSDLAKNIEPIRIFSPTGNLRIILAPNEVVWFEHGNLSKYLYIASDTREPIATILPNFEPERAGIEGNNLKIKSIDFSISRSPKPEKLNAKLVSINGQSIFIYYDIESNYYKIYGKEVTD